MSLFAPATLHSVTLAPPIVHRSCTDGGYNRSVVHPTYMTRCHLLAVLREHAQQVVGLAVRARTASCNRAPSLAVCRSRSSGLQFGARTARRDRTAFTGRLPQQVVGFAVRARTARRYRAAFADVCRSRSSGLQFAPGRHVAIGPPSLHLPQLVVGLAVRARTARRNRSAFTAICRSWSSGLQFAPGRHVAIGAAFTHLPQQVVGLAVRPRTARRDRSAFTPSAAAGRPACSSRPDGTLGSARLREWSSIGEALGGELGGYCAGRNRECDQR